MRIRDWSSDVCSSDLLGVIPPPSIASLQCHPLQVDHRARRNLSRQDVRTDPAIIGMDAQHALAPNLSDCNVVDFAKRQRINEHARFPESVYTEAHSPTSEPHSSAVLPAGASYSIPPARRRGAIALSISKPRL